MNKLMFARQTCLKCLLPISLAWICLWLLFSIIQSGHALSAKMTASGQEYTDGEATQVITIGVAVDLSGPVSSLGWVEANSVQLAITQTKAAGGIVINGTAHPLAALVVDDQCNPERALEVAQTLRNAGVVAVVGHTCSGASLAAQAIYQAAGIAMISPSATAPILTQQGYTNTFRTVPHDGSIAIPLATYFREELKCSRSAIVETSWWLGPGDSYSSTFTSLGGTITGRHVVTDTSNFTATLTAIRLEDADVIANFYTEADAATAGGLLSKIAYELGMEQVVIGWNADSNDEALLDAYAQAAGAFAVEDDYVVMKGRRFQEMPGWADFLTAYRAAGFANQPNDPTIYGVYAYDAAGIILSAIARAQSTAATAIRDQIAATKDYAGVIGTYRGFDGNGDAIPHWSWLMYHSNGQWNDLRPTRLFLPAVLKNPLP